MWPLRYATASQEIPLGPFKDSTDFVTAETGLTIANTDIKLFKNGATTEASKNSGGATHIASGRYYAVLDATDSNTYGPMRVSVAVSGALEVWLDCCVYPPEVFDALYAGTVKYLSTAYAGIKDASQTAQAYSSTTLTLVNGTAAMPGDVITIESATTGTGQTVTIASKNTDVSTAHVATVDPGFSPELTGTVVYTARVAPRNPETNLPKVNIYYVKDTLLGAGLDITTALSGIKTKTDSLTFTQSGYADVNVQYVMDLDLRLNGTGGQNIGAT